MPLFLEQFPTQTVARERQDIGQEEKARNSTCTWKKPEENKQFARKPSCKSRSAATNTQSYGIICKSLINNGMASERQKLGSQMKYKLMWCQQLRWVQFTVFILPKRKLVSSVLLSSDHDRRINHKCVCERKCQKGILCNSYFFDKVLLKKVFNTPLPHAFYI